MASHLFSRALLVSCLALAACGSDGSGSAFTPNTRTTTEDVIGSSGCQPVFGAGLVAAACSPGQLYGGAPRPSAAKLLFTFPDDSHRAGVVPGLVQASGPPLGSGSRFDVVGEAASDTVLLVRAESDSWLFQAIFKRIDLGSEHRATVEITGSGGDLEFRLRPSNGRTQVPAVVQRVR